MIGRKMGISTSMLVALLFAVGAGIAISVQSSVMSAAGPTVGPLRTAFFAHLGGALVGAVILGILAVTGNSHAPTEPTGRLTLLILLAGAMGMIILPSIVLSFPRTGLVAGQMAVIGGQMLVAVLVDTLGLAGKDPIPLDGQRLVGLALMVVAAYLLLPKSG